MKLNKIDRQLLYHLSSDASLSLTHLAKLMKTSKQAISYNLNKLVEEGVIKMFYAVIDHSRLGSMGFRIMIRLSQSSPKKQKALTEFLVRHRNVRRILSVDDFYDMIVEVVQEDPNNLYDLLIAIDEKYGKFVSEIDVELVRSRDMLPFRMFSENPGKHEGLKIYYKKHDKVYVLDRIDKALLKELEGNCRLDYVKMADELKVNPKTLIYRRKRLEEEKIIAGYGIVVRWNRLNKVRYRILIEPLVYNRKKFTEMKDFIRADRNVIGMKQVISKYMVEFDIVANSYNEVIIFLDSLKERYSDLIKNYDIVHIRDIIRKEVISGYKEKEK